MSARRWRGRAVVIGLLGLTLAIAGGALWLLRAVQQPQPTAQPVAPPVGRGQHAETLDAGDRNELQRILERKGAGRHP
jgi:hypothetical protein